MVVAIVLAGGQKNGFLTEGGELSYNEALLKIGDKFMIEYVLEALQGSQYIQRIIVAGQAENLQTVFSGRADITIVQGGETIIASFKNAFKEFKNLSAKLSIVTGDLPLLTTEAVDHFLAAGLSREGDLFDPVVAREAHEEKYPGVQRTY
ncbi:MAG: nucleotidyltransferase family protein, partial [Clostridia bacterium]|nr:nucleotidyltransferase family protein [Clostridia bacterium]